MKIEAWLITTVKDHRTGRVLSITRQPSRSYVLSFLDGLHVHMSASSDNIRDVGGTLRAVLNFQWYNDCDEGAGSATHGIVVGTGTNAVAIGDYKLQTLIAHGIGAGQLDYLASQFTAPVTVGTRRHFYATRSFLNQSGSSITVEECGIYCRSTPSSWFFCTVRDIIAGGQVVPNGSTLTVQYEIYVDA